MAQSDYDRADAAILAKLREHGVDESRMLAVFNKADAHSVESAVKGAWASSGALPVSAKSGQGLFELKHALLARAGWQALPEGVAIARTRHLQALQRCAQHLAFAQAQLVGASPALDLLAEELRLAHQALGDITGQLSADDLLGVIFSSFCIGK
jgi:tRNA modification GTPase